MAATQPPTAELHRPTLLKVVAAIERRIADLDRLGPPTAPGHACGTCKDAELHRLLGVLRELAGAKPH
jgi:NAD(P)H-nitrite reductase large subunit